LLYRSLIVLCVAGWNAWAQLPGLPPAVVNAHSVYIQNETGFTELEYTTILELNIPNVCTWMEVT
jgi:hypothetical protein